MSDAPEQRIYLGLIEDAEGGRLSAVAGDGDERLFAWGPTARPAEVDQVILEMLD